jgi:hypothetical protein
MQADGPICGISEGRRVCRAAVRGKKASLSEPIRVGVAHR